MKEICLNYERQVLTTQLAWVEKLKWGHPSLQTLRQLL